MSTRPIPPSVRDKLGKLFLMLSLPNAGEQTAAAVAIRRVFAAAGLDWHDVTKIIIAPAPPPPPPPPQPPPSSPSASRELGTTTFTAAELTDLITKMRARVVSSTDNRKNSSIVYWSAATALPPFLSLQRCWPGFQASHGKPNY
jgi:hypothetical protein